MAAPVATSVTPPLEPGDWKVVHNDGKTARAQTRQRGPQHRHKPQALTPGPTPERSVNVSLEVQTFRQRAAAAYPGQHLLRPSSSPPTVIDRAHYSPRPTSLAHAPHGTRPLTAPPRSSPLPSHRPSAPPPPLTTGRRWPSRTTRRRPTYHQQRHRRGHVRRHRPSTRDGHDAATGRGGRHHRRGDRPWRRWHRCLPPRGLLRSLAMGGVGGDHRGAAGVGGSEGGGGLRGHRGGAAWKNGNVCRNGRGG